MVDTMCPFTLIYHSVFVHKLFFMSSHSGLMTVVINPFQCAGAVIRQRYMHRWCKSCTWLLYMFAVIHEYMNTMNVCNSSDYTTNVEYV